MKCPWVWPTAAARACRAFAYRGTNKAFFAISRLRAIFGQFLYNNSKRSQKFLAIDNFVGVLVNQTDYVVNLPRLTFFLAHVTALQL